MLKGDGVGWLVSKRLRKLMMDEALRAMVANRLYSAPSADTNTDAVDDMVSCNHYYYFVSRMIDNWLKMRIGHCHKVNVTDAALAQLRSKQQFKSKVTLYKLSKLESTVPNNFHCRF